MTLTHIHRVWRRVALTLLLPTLLLCCLAACGDSKPHKKSAKRAALVAKIDSINAILPQPLNNEITWIKATILHNQVRYIYHVSTDYMNQIDNAATRELHRNSLLPEGKSYLLGHKLAKEGLGIAFIYTDTLNANSKLTIEFTPEELRDLYADEEAGNAPAK